MATWTQEYQRLGQEVVNRGLLEPEDLVEAIRVQKQQGRPLPEVLVGMGLVSAEELLATRGMMLNLPVVDLRGQRVNPELLAYVPEALARRHRAIPVEFQGHTLLVAMAEPEDLQAVEDLQAQAGVRLQPALADAEQIIQAIDLYYKATSQIEMHLRDSPGLPTQERAALSQAEEALRQTPVVRTLDLLLVQAIRERASDIHLEPQPGRLRVRYRIDGVLQEVLSLSMAIHAPLVSRLKILAQLNIAERRLPQDGQFTFRSSGKEADVRVATVETSHGEMAVLRLLDKSTVLLDLSSLGFLPEARARYEAMLRMPYGLILISGPTGSGKTTSLYASVNALDCQSKNIVTIEDPIEYQVTDINQIQVNAKAGLTFASGLRALMRHDPDVILVGEIRDSDTARTAVQAALTGHLVLSSIHANEAEGVVHRLIHLGVEPFLIASALVGVVAQRMVRRVCPSCAVVRQAPPEEQLIFEREMEASQSEFSYGQGCQFCASTGHRGRTGIFEVMTVTESLRHLILSGAESRALRRQALQEGMTSMLRDGLEKARQGTTTPTEVLRNLYSVNLEQA